MFLERALIDVSVLISKAFPKFLIVYSCEFGFVLEHNFPLVFSLNASLEKTILPELIYPGPFIFFLWFLISSHRKSFSLSFPQLSHFCPYQTFHRWNHSIATIIIPNIKYRNRLQFCPKGVTSIQMYILTLAASFSCSCSAQVFVSVDWSSLSGFALCFHTT